MAERAFDITMPEFADVLSQYGINVARPPAQDAIAPMPRNPAQMPEPFNAAVRSVASGVVDTFAAPGRAMQGRYAVKPTVPGLWSEEDEFRQQRAQGQQVIDAGGMSIDLAGGGTAFAQKGAAGIFGGKLAKTANLENLAKAEQFESAGLTPETIRLSTGWFRGADGEWRFEIPDRPATLLAPLEPNKESTTVNRALWHPELFEAYPDLADASLMLNGMPGSGTYYKKGSYGNPNEEAVRVAPRDPARDRSVLLHELQHAVQEREGFAKGTNPAALTTLAGRMSNYHLGKYPEWTAKLPEVRKRLREGTATPEDHKFVDQFNAMSPGKLAYEAYRRHAGEVEARNVEARANMTPRELRNTPPQATEDVPLDKQMVVRQPKYYSAPSIPEIEAVLQQFGVLPKKQVK